MTYGEYRVGISFNPAANEHVNEIKRRAADLIDYIHDWSMSNSGEGNFEADRLAGRAIDTIDDAAMQAVKAITKEPMT